jgi:hypothetical protein
MLKITLLMVFICCGLSCMAQHAIRADHAIDHIGQTSVVIDSIASVSVNQDHSISIFLGSKRSKPLLQVLVRCKSILEINADLLSVDTYPILEVTGLIAMDKALPTIEVTDEQQLYFFPGHKKRDRRLVASLD